METNQDFYQQEKYRRAKERLKLIKDFYGNLISYCIVIPILIWINYRTSDFPWVIFPIIGWGIGVVTHAMEAYGFNPFFGKAWEERKIREFMDEEKKKF